MLICLHHTAVDVIDLNNRTGNWVPVDERDDDTLMVGLMTMAQRADYVIRGSYAIENDKRCSFYWNDDRALKRSLEELEKIALASAPPDVPTAASASASAGTLVDKSMCALGQPA